LGWFIECFYNGSDTIFVVGVFREVAIEKAYLLDHVILRNPMAEKHFDIIVVHEFYIIYVTVDLSFNYTGIGHAFCTHGLFEGDVVGTG
jgi:hypothetical protein